MGAAVEQPAVPGQSRFEQGRAEGVGKAIEHRCQFLARGGEAVQVDNRVLRPLAAGKPANAFLRARNQRDAIRDKTLGTGEVGLDVRSDQFTLVTH